ncbi:MAG: hypothetical protein WDN00_11590 [Limisphaerales bacterium]
MTTTNTTTGNLNVEKTFADRCVQSCKKLLTGIDQAKRRIISEFRPTRESQENLFKQAVNEAEALAWQTPYPHLFFPSLAVEKVQAVVAWQTRQQSLRQRQPLFAEAA